MRQQVREGFVKVVTSEQSPEGNEEASRGPREKHREKQPPSHQERVADRPAQSPPHPRVTVPQTQLSLILTATVPFYR